MEESLWILKSVTFAVGKIAVYQHGSTSFCAIPNMLFVLHLISAKHCNCWMNYILLKVKNSFFFITAKARYIQKYIILQAKSLCARMYGVKLSLYV